MATPTPSPFGKLSEALRKDPKKSAILIGLFAALAVLLGRMFMSVSPTAASASLASTALRPGGAVGAARPSGPNVRPGGTAVLPGTGGPSEPARIALQDWLSQPVGAVSRNLFLVRLEYFPLQSAKNVPKSGNDVGFWNQLEKSLSNQADQNVKRETYMSTLRSEAEALSLQSTMMGTTPRAMVNGALVGEGDSVGGFKVQKIESRRIIVEREGVRLEIEMK